MAWTDPMTAVPGEAFDASEFNTHVRDNFNALRWQWIRKTADESVTSSTVLQDDNHLALPVLSGETWAFQMVLFVLAPTLADIEIALAVPASTTGEWGAIGDGSFRAFAAFGDANSIIFNGAGTVDMTILVHGLVVVGTNGVVQLRWTQDVSNASPTTMRANSYILGHRFL